MNPHDYSNRTTRLADLGRRASRAFLLAFAFCSFHLTGCAWPSREPKRHELGVDPRHGALTQSAAYRDTIGSLGFFDGMGAMRVRGYGLVVGLGKSGSSDCPRRIYDKLVQSIYKQYHSTVTVVGTKDISPERLIADVDTAVVVVQGDIPPAAVKGTRFDVWVTALPGTQTKSLRGGRLYTADLEMYRPTTSGIAITGRVLARAGGPIFQNPFSDAASATQSNLLEGVLLGGGVVLEDRRIRFVVTEPSYPAVRRIEQRINAQFTGPQKIADAVSPSFVQVAVPEEYADQTGHFLELVRQLYLSRDPQFEATRARELATQLVSPAAPHGLISLSLEGLGRSALSVLDDLYAHPKDYVSFYAAVAGIRLGDHVACDRMALHAADPADEYRFQAIRALAEAKGMAAAAIALRHLLVDDDPRVQVAAYEALIERRDALLASRTIGRENFALDLVPSSPQRFVYAKRSRDRRIALFGDALTCVPPLLYRAPDGSITLTAAAEAPRITILRMVTSSGTTSEPIDAPLELPALVELLGGEPGVDEDRRATGLGVDYADVVRLLYELCHSNVVDAEFILEGPNAAELFGPTPPAGRPESEL